MYALHAMRCNMYSMFNINAMIMRSAWKYVIHSLGDAYGFKPLV